MRKITFLIIALSYTCFVHAQHTTSFNLTFNHLALSVKDVDRSVEFYKKVLGLNEISNRAKLTGMRWISLGGNMELHLISIGNKNIIADTAIHFALATRHFDKFVKRMNEMNIPFENADGKVNTFNVRADGVKQIYFKDPDGYWIEVNNIGQK